MCISVCACLPVHVRVCRECVIYTHGSTLVFVPIRTSVYFLLSIVSLFELLYLSLYCIFKTNQREVMFNISTLFFFLLLFPSSHHLFRFARQRCINLILK